MAKAKPRCNDDQPIYRQLMENVVNSIIDGIYPEGELLPSVRQLAIEYGVSPLTAANVFQEFSRDNLTE